MTKQGIDRWLVRIAIAGLTCLVQACGSGGGSEAGGGSPPSIPGPVDPTPPATNDQVPLSEVFPAFARDLEWVASQGLLYLSLPGQNGPQGNVIVALDPATNRIVHRRETDSEPGEIAASTDGRYLYVGLNGTGRVQRYLLPDLRPDLAFSLPPEPGGLPTFVDAMAVLPGRPESVVLSVGPDPLQRLGDRVHIFDNGVARAESARMSCASMALNATGDRVYCVGNSALASLDEAVVQERGLSVTSPLNLAFTTIYTQIHFEPLTGLVYGSDGTVVDPVARRVIRRLEASGPVVFDPAANRLRVASPDASIRSFDATTYRPTPAVTPYPLQGVPLRMVRWGDKGLALTTSESRVLLFGAFGTTSFDTSTPRSAATVRVVAIGPGRMTWEPVSGKLYAPIAASAPSEPDRVAEIDPETAQVTRTRTVGRGARAIAASVDGQFLYVGVDDEAAVRRFRLPAFEAELTLNLADAPPFERTPAKEIRASPTAPRTIAVARELSPPSSFMTSGLLVIDDATPRPAPSTVFRPDLTGNLNPLDVAWSNDGSSLSCLSEPSQLYELRVGSGVWSVGAAGKHWYAAGRIHKDPVSRRLVLDSGAAFDEASLAPAALYRRSLRFLPTVVAVDSAHGLVYALESDNTTVPSVTTLAAYDLRRAVPRRIYALPTDPFDHASELLVLRPGLLAFRSAQGVFILRLDVLP